MLYILHIFLSEKRYPDFITDQCGKYEKHSTEPHLD